MTQQVEDDDFSESWHGLQMPARLLLYQAGRKQQKLCTAQPIKHNLVIKIFCLVTVELNNLAGTGCLVEFGARYEQLTVSPIIFYYPEICRQAILV